jgi:hypothetical protein
VNPAERHTHSNTVFELLVSLTAIIVTARVMGAIFQYLYQPAVIGEVLGGIMLGPSLLGYFAPNLYALALPPGVAPFLSVHAQVGVILYMFIVGLELDTGVVRTSGLCDARHLARQHHRALHAGIGPGARALPGVVVQRSAIHGVRAVHRCRHVDHGVSGSRPHPDGSEDASHTMVRWR